MKILILGPYSSPIIQRLKLNLETIGGHEVWIASHNINTDIDNHLLSLGQLNSFFDYFNFFKINKIVKILKPDLVHAHIINHYGLMALFQSSPLVVALWGSDVMLALNIKSHIKRSFYKIIIYLVAMKSRAMHTSSQHIKEEIQKHLGKKLSSKIKCFYWGFPVNAPNPIQHQEINNRLFEEFKIPPKKLFVFTRGLAPIYDPTSMVTIINKLLSSNLPLPIVVLRGFATDEQMEAFKCNLSENFKKIIFIDRLLSSEELYCLYSNTAFHCSIPLSDALGGGVIEPVQLGSIPILSNIPPYQDYIANNTGFILQDYSNLALSNLYEYITNFDISVRNHCLETYSAVNIINKISNIYINVSKV